MHRSYLFVPADRPDRFDKAWASNLARSASALASFASYADPLLSQTEIVSWGPESHSDLGKAETS
jgi:hypothetical protein